MALVLDGMSKSYGANEILRPVDLKITDGEFLTVLGPSGSGKTTILRLIAGFAQPSRGRILLDGDNLAGTPASKRPFNTVFQDYALFPHMTVEENVGYGLSVRRRARSEIVVKVAEALAMVGLKDMGRRYPSQMSGGQRQRVALARAIVCEPRLVLLDEPLSALDAELRRQMQEFLKDFQRRIGTTFLFVTHDQEEAIALSDRLVVMNVGGVEQVGTPNDVYYTPRTPFVAGFFGDNNLIPAQVEAGAVLSTPFGAVPLPAGASATPRKVLMALRPELLQPGAAENALNIAGRVESITFAGAMSLLKLRSVALPDQPLLIKMTSSGEARALTRDAEMTVAISHRDIAIVETGE